MTLLEYLRSLPADPLAPGPNLIVAEGVLGKWDREAILSPPYNRRPYCVVNGLPRGAPMQLHNGRTRLAGAIDIHLFHPRSGSDPPDGDSLAHLQALVLEARTVVTEIREGYAFASPLALVTETDPRFATFDQLDGLTAVTRFTYQLWR